MKVFSRKTLTLIVFIIILGFGGTVLTNYIQNRRAYDDQRSAITKLTNEQIYYEIEGIFQLLIERSLVLSTDRSVLELLDAEDELEEGQGAERAVLEEDIRLLLEEFRLLFDCDTVFLVSEYNKHYYSDMGLTLAYERGDGQSEWYFDLMAQEENYILNVDDDLSRDGVITLFVNCKIHDSEGRIVGAAGFGIHLDGVQEVLTRNGLYTDMSAYLIYDDGVISMTSQEPELVDTDFFTLDNFADLREPVTEGDGTQFFLRTGGGQRNYVASRDMRSAPWILVTVMRTATFDSGLQSMMISALTICISIILVVVLAIRRAMSGYERQLHRYEAQRKEQSKSSEMRRRIYMKTYSMSICRVISARMRRLTSISA